MLLNREIKIFLSTGKLQPHKMKKDSNDTHSCALIGRLFILNALSPELASTSHSIPNPQQLFYFCFETLYLLRTTIFIFMDKLRERYSI